MITNCDDNDVLVVLGELSVFNAIIWKFPKTTICPLDECGQSFSSPSDSVEHFCQQHAAKAMLCFVCNTIFFAENLTNLQQHYDINHPDKSPPKLKSVILESVFTFI